MPIAVPILAEAGFDLAVAEGVAEALLEAEELGLGGALEIVEGLRGGFSAGELAAAFAGGAFIGAPAALVEAIAALVGAARRRRRGFRPKFRIAPVRMPPPPPVALVGSSDACRESMYAPCGNDLATLGYRALASYNGSSGTLTGLSKNCLNLFVTMSPSAVDAGVVLPTVCGDDCLQFDGVEPMNWDLFVNMTEVTLWRWRA